MRHTYKYITTNIHNTLSHIYSQNHSPHERDKRKMTFCKSENHNKKYSDRAKVVITVMIMFYSRNLEGEVMAGSA